MEGNEDPYRPQPEMMPLREPPPAQLPDPRPPKKVGNARRFATIYYVVIFALFGFPALVNWAYGASQWGNAFFFVFLMFGVPPLLLRAARRRP